jgi:hypothetical protein
MTDEHVPPKSTGNHEKVELVMDSFDLNSVLLEVAEWDEGHIVRTLDNRCNKRASDWGYVKEYRRWHEWFLAAAHAAGQENLVDPFKGEKAFSMQLQYDLMPARFVRQVIGMLLAVQESQKLIVDFPRLAELIGSEPRNDQQPRSAGTSIEPLHLYMSVYSGSWGYGTSPFLQITMDLTHSSLIVPAGARTQDLQVYLLALTPFVFVAASEPSANFGLSVQEWTTWDRSQRSARPMPTLDVPTVDMMEPWLRAMLEPNDYTFR